MTSFLRKTNAVKRKEMGEEGGERNGPCCSKCKKLHIRIESSRDLLNCMVTVVTNKLMDLTTAKRESQMFPKGKTISL